MGYCPKGQCASLDVLIRLVGQSPDMDAGRVSASGQGGLGAQGHLKLSLRPGLVRARLSRCAGPKAGQGVEKLDHLMEHPIMRIIRTGSILIMAALGWAVAASPAFTQNAPQCVVSGSPPAGWGFNSIGYIEIASGGSCMLSFNITGEILSSSVFQHPAHGTLQQLNLSSFIYTSEAGYRGRDAFSVQATGKSQTSSGASVFTINATLQ